MSRQLRFPFQITAILPLLVIPCLVHAEWMPGGTPVSVAAARQYLPAPATDGHGGAIIAWEDNRNGSYDIYVQRIDAMGEPLWALDGIPVCLADDDQNKAQVVSDGEGGAYIVWEDQRSGTSYDIYAQRIDSEGTALWLADGVLLSDAVDDQRDPAIAAAGSGGAFVVWEDRQSGIDYDIYSQWIGADGSILGLSGGLPICTELGDQDNPVILQNELWGSFIVWKDRRSGSSDLYANYLGANGRRAWASEGTPVCTLSGTQSSARMILDETGGVFIIWQDQRSGMYPDIYAQRLDKDGNSLWASDGLPVCAEARSQYRPGFTSDESGGFIASWADTRVPGKYDIYAQRVDADGTPLWAAGGIAVCSDSTVKEYPEIVSDGGGGAIIAWVDDRNSSLTWQDMYAQWIDGEGTARWEAGGKVICASPASEYEPHMISDGAGGAIISWAHFSDLGDNIFAQMVWRDRVGFTGPSIRAARDVPGDQGRIIELSWYAARAELLLDGQVSYYSTWRAINPAKAGFLAKTGVPILPDLSRFSASGGPVIRMEKRTDGPFFWEYVADAGAYYLDAYAMMTPTLFDSTEISDEYHYFQVIAHTDDPAVFWVSEPDSGYSVDNLSPVTPGGFTGKYAPVSGALVLWWDRNREEDLAGYQVYQGDTEDFIPSDENLVASTSDTLALLGAFSTDGGEYLKVSAVDIHGNESEFAYLKADNFSGVAPGAVPSSFVLHANVPNPFNPATTIRFSIPESRLVKLSIFTVDGRHVTTLLEEAMPGGSHEIVWTGRDESGRSVGSGCYFYRLDADKESRTNRMILIR